MARNSCGVWYPPLFFLPRFFCMNYCNVWTRSTVLALFKLYNYVSSTAVWRNRHSELFVLFNLAKDTGAGHMGVLILAGLAQSLFFGAPPPFRSAPIPRSPPWTNGQKTPSSFATVEITTLFPQTRKKEKKNKYPSFSLFLLHTAPLSKQLTAEGGEEKKFG